jgi:hypothetical protein
MNGLRAVFAAAVSVSIATVPAMGAPNPATTLGTVITAEHAHVGEAAAEVGTTVFTGDRLYTEPQGSVQVRAGAARLLLLSSSSAVIDDREGAPSAKLVKGTATFSTGNAHAFTLYASRAAVRAQTDAPTIGQVTYLSDKELLVISKRGSLTITVDGETEIIPEGTAYRVLLDATAAAAAQGPAGAGSNKKAGGSGPSGPPLKAGRSYFLVVAVGVTAIATYFAVSESLESANRP